MMSTLELIDMRERHCDGESTRQDLYDVIDSHLEALCHIGTMQAALEELQACTREQGESVICS